MAESLVQLVQRQTSSSRPSEVNAPTHHNSRAGGIAAGVIIIILLLIIVIASFYGYRFWKARKHGLPPPSLNPFASQSAVSTRNYPARGGVSGWFQSKFRGMRNKRTAGGAYESGRGGRGFGPVDQDEGAWDTNIHHDEEAGYGGGRGYYEEQELGLTGRHARNDSDGSYVGGGGTYGQMDTGYHAPRGLEDSGPRGGHSRGISEYDASNHGAHSDPFADPAAERSNPFGESAERSNMPGGGRPTVETKKSHAGKSTKGDSPTSERRSIFHEEM